MIRVTGKIVDGFFGGGGWNGEGKRVRLEGGPVICKQSTSNKPIQSFAKPNTSY